MKFNGHVTVLKEETVNAVLENTITSEDQFFVDMTFGGGGHCFYLSQNNSKAKVVGLDQDPDALDSGRKRIIDEDKEKEILLENSNFVQIAEVLKRESVVNFTAGRTLGGCYADLGVSSHQFDVAERGFSFRFDGHFRYEDESR